jgi:hypothetical protein
MSALLLRESLHRVYSVEKLENAPAAFSAKLSRGRQFAV